MLEKRQTEIFNFIQTHENCSTGEIHKEYETSFSYATVKRILSQLLSKRFIITVGKGKGTRYFISPSYELLNSIDLESYYQKEIDEREIKENFNAKGLKKAKEELSILKLPEEERIAYERYQDDLHYQASMVESSYTIGVIKGEKKGREEGKKEGREEGEKKKAVEIAKNLIEILDTKTIFYHHI